MAEVLRKIFGYPTLELVRKFEKKDIKHEKALLDFCEDHNVIPKFLHFKIANF